FFEMIYYFSFSDDFFVEEKKFPFLEKLLLDIINMVLALLFKQPNKANLYNMELALEIAEKENNQCKSNTPKTTLFEKKMLSPRPKQIHFPIVVSPDIGNIQVDMYIYLHSQESTSIFLLSCFYVFFYHFIVTKRTSNLILQFLDYPEYFRYLIKRILRNNALVMIKFGMELKSSLSSMEKYLILDTRKTEKKPQVNVYTINLMIFGMYIFSSTKKTSDLLLLQQKYLDKIIISEHSRGGDRIEKYYFFFCVDDEKVSDSYQKGIQKKKRTLHGTPAVERSKLDNRRQSLQLSRSFKVDNEKRDHQKEKHDTTITTSDRNTTATKYSSKWAIVSCLKTYSDFGKGEKFVTVELNKWDDVSKNRNCKPDEDLKTLARFSRSLPN
ncbi:hypothetical protein RFI_38268, partial [Reticulomyxa filosa]